jgi:hypothetical protein
VDGHPVSWLRQWAKSELGVQPVGIPRGQEKYAEILEIGMAEDGPHEGLRYSSAPTFWDYKYVHQVREHRSVRYHASEGNLPPALIRAEAEGVRNGTLNHVAASPFGPVGRLQEFVHEIDVQTSASRRDSSSVSRFIFFRWPPNDSAEPRASATA